MKIFLACAMTVGLITVAYAGNCTTRCHQVGNQWICNQSCY